MFSRTLIVNEWAEYFMLSFFNTTIYTFEIWKWCSGLGCGVDDLISVYENYCEFVASVCLEID